MIIAAYENVNGIIRMTDVETDSFGLTILNEEDTLEATVTVDNNTAKIKAFLWSLGDGGMKILDDLVLVPAE